LGDEIGVEVGIEKPMRGREDVVVSMLKKSRKP
jgi:hypothetical protein